MAGCFCTGACGGNPANCYNLMLSRPGAIVEVNRNRIHPWVWQVQIEAVKESATAQQDAAWRDLAGLQSTPKRSAMSTKCGIYDLIQHVETGKIWRWFRDGRETPEGFVEFETDSPRDYAIMRRYRPYLDIAKERS